MEMALSDFNAKFQRYVDLFGLDHEPSDSPSAPFGGIWFPSRQDNGEMQFHKTIKNYFGHTFMSLTCAGSSGTEAKFERALCSGASDLIYRERDRLNYYSDPQLLLDDLAKIESIFTELAGANFDFRLAPIALMMHSNITNGTRTEFKYDIKGYIELVILTNGKFPLLMSLLCSDISPEEIKTSLGMPESQLRALYSREEVS